MTAIDEADLNEPSARILLIEDDPGLQRQMRWGLAPFETVTAGTRAEAVKQFEGAGPFRIVILDLGLPPDDEGTSEGLRTLKELLELEPTTKIIVATGSPDRSSAVNAIREGAFDFFSKPVDLEILKLIIERGFRLSALEEENRALRTAQAAPHGLISASAPMENVRRMIDRLGPTNVTVLVTGESGVGKEVVARALHTLSPRRERPFAAINCASIPEALLESELFGHERGAFTGAVKQTQGKFELADKGTLFLDEIGDMPMSLQAKVLRFLQERRFERVGGRQSIAVDVRVISATNRPLDAMISEGKFREDLYYRLNEVSIVLPPLRERERDAVLLAYHFLNVCNRAFGRDVAGFTDDGLGAIETHPWPGNIRELEGRIKRAVVMAEGRLITAADLDLKAGASEPRSFNLKTETSRLERALVQEALAVSQGNVSKAAKLLGISRPQLYNLKRLRQF